MSSTTNYTGRSVDILIMQGATLTGRAPIDLSFAGETGGLVTTGVQKAVQTFMLVFFTEAGTKAGSPTFGTKFIADLRGSNISAGQISLLFREAVTRVLEQQQQYLEDDAEDDEVIVDATLDDFEIIDRTKLSMIVSITTRAGDTRVIYVPVSLAIR